MSQPTAIQDAVSFLSPLFDREQVRALRDTPLILRLSKSLTPSTDRRRATEVVILHALTLLANIHQALLLLDADTDATRLENPADRRTILALLDLIVLEGIYPSLSPGIGVPLERRARSLILPSRPSIARVQELEEGDKTLLKAILSGLLGILETTGTSVNKDRKLPVNSTQKYQGVEGFIHERCLVDVLAGCGDLAFNQHITDDNADEWKHRFERLIDRIPTGDLLPRLLSLLHPMAPKSFRDPIAKTLSLLPISRPYGVRSILELFLANTSQDTTEGAPSQLSIENFSQASRLILSVPSTVSSDNYFGQVCSQLLELLNSKDIGLQRAAAYIIAELLGKKGDAESIVKREIVQKVTSKLDPRVSPPLLAEEILEPIPPKKPSSSTLLELEEPKSRTFFSDESARQTREAFTGDTILVREDELSSAIHTIELLLSSHPTPIVPQRMISPIFIPLWGLLCFAKSTGRSTWYSRVAAILKSYLVVSLDKSLLNNLVTNLMSDQIGRAEYEYAAGSSGGIEIRSRTARKTTLDMEQVSLRVDEFVGLIDDERIKTVVLDEFFLGILRTWLARGDVEDPVKMLVIVKVLQELLGKYADALAKKPTEILQIVNSVLEEYVQHHQDIHLKIAATPKEVKPQLNALANIVQHTEPVLPKSKVAEDEESERIQTVSMALSLLTIVISSPEAKLAPSDERLLAALDPPLSYISSTSTIDPSLRPLAINITSLISAYTPSNSTTAPSSRSEQQKQQYATALSYLQDPLIPVRVHGLHLLRELILEKAPVIDVTGTARLLVTMMKDTDSFVYLNIIKCLAALTDRHSKTVTRLLVDAYLNEEDVLGLEKEGVDLGLDERLRIGETLLKTVQRLASALVGEIAEYVGRGMIAVVSRRKKVRAKETKNKVPDLDTSRKKTDDDDDEGEEFDMEFEELTEQQKKEREMQTKIVEGWATAGGPAAEDIRMRTSALSILGAAFEANVLGVGAVILRDAVDMCLAILTLEKSAENGILRRAAAVCIGSALKAIVDIDEGENTVSRSSRAALSKIFMERLSGLRNVLGYVRVTDSDGLVREQAGVVAENLEAAMQQWAFGREEDTTMGRIRELNIR